MSHHSLRVALVGVDPAVRKALDEIELPGKRRVEIAHQLEAPLAELGREDAAQLTSGDVHVVMIGMGDDPQTGIKIAAYLGDAAPGLHMIGSGPGLQPDILMQAMRAGMNEYLLAPVTATDLGEALNRAWKRHSFVEHELHGAEVDSRGKVFAFLPVKGGTGTTTAAVNLAVALQQATGERTLLVDLDMELGGVALLLGLRPRFSFLDLARNFHRLDPNLVSSYVESHPSGLDVLAAPLRPERSDVIAAEESAKIIDFLRQTYKYVVLDMSKSLSPMMLSVLEAADKIIAVTTADLPTLGSLKRLLPVLQRLDDNSMDRIRVVVNRYHPDGQVTIDDIRTLLDMDVHWTLSNDYRSAIKAANEGRPITLNGRSPYSRDIESIIGGLVDLPGAPATNGDGGLAAPLKRLFGLKK